MNLINNRQIMVHPLPEPQGFQKCVTAPVKTFSHIKVSEYSIQRLSDNTVHTAMFSEAGAHKPLNVRLTWFQKSIHYLKQVLVL